MKTRYAIANWKMYKTAALGASYVEELLALIEGSPVRVYLAAPFTAIHAAAQMAMGTPISIGAQTMSELKEGAYTGEISSIMLKEAGADFVLLGHSERRHLFGESNAMIHKKLIRALQDDLTPVLCVGECDGCDLQETLQEQLSSAFDHIAPIDAAKVMVAYEPVWAIGTGKTATTAQIQKAHEMVRAMLQKIFGSVGKTIPILYGGSVKPDNVYEIVNNEHVDGVLVGGASLDPKSFSQIVCNMEKQ